MELTKERGAFYQNFVLGLLNSKKCVGWHWYRYFDKIDPHNKTTANKGVVNKKYKPYEILHIAMREINKEIYYLIRYFDND